MPKVDQTVPLSEAEMMARMYEAVMGKGYERPPGMGAEGFIERMPDKDQRNDFVHAVRAAMLYLVEVAASVTVTDSAIGHSVH